VVQAVWTAAFLAPVWMQSYFAAWFQERSLHPRLVAELPGVLARYPYLLLLGSGGLALWHLWTARRKRLSVEEAVAWSAAGLLCCFIIWTRGLQFSYSLDDSYIDYRHVRNLVNHFSLDYHPGARTMAFTSHLHLWILALASWLTGSQDIALLSQIINVAAQLAAFVLVFRLATSWLENQWLGLSAAAIYAVLPYHLAESTIGKETFLVHLLLLWGMHSLGRQAWTGLAWSATLLFLSRPEGVFWLVWTLWVAWRRCELKALLRAWLPPLALAAVWYAVLLVCFGTILPSGMLAKKVVYFGSRGAAFKHLMTFLEPPFGLAPGFPHVQLLLLALALYMALGRRPETRYYLLGVAPIALFQAVAGPALLFSWYFCWFSLLPVLGIPWFAKAAWSGFAREGGWPRQALLGLGLLYIVLSMLGPLNVLRLGGQVRSLLFHWHSNKDRLLYYAEAVERVKARPLRGVFATVEIGIAGYVWGDEILDIGAIASPAMLRYYPPPEPMRSSAIRDGVFYTVPPRLVHDTVPECILTVDQFARHGLLEDEFFKTRYTTDRAWPIDWWGVKGAVVLYCLRP
jgi:hypothetical protein